MWHACAFRAGLRVPWPSAVSRPRLALAPATLPTRSFRHDDFKYESELERRREEERELALRHTLKGRQMESFDDFAGAMKEFETALKYNDSDPDVLAAISGCALRMPNPEKALEFAEKAAVAARKEHRHELVGLAQSRAALVLYNQGRLKEAQKAILEAQLFIPSSEDLLYLLDETEHKLKTKVMWQSAKEEDLRRQRSYLNQVVSQAPVEVRISEDKGRGLFATRDINEGEAIFAEAPIVATASWGNESSYFCFASVQPLGEPALEFASDEAQAIFNRMSEHEQRALKQQLCEKFQLPALASQQKCEQCGIAHFADKNVEVFARDTYLASLCRGQCATDSDTQTLLPSIFAPHYLPKTDGGDPLLIHHEIVALELVTLLVARINKSPELWDNFVKYLLYAEKRPSRALLDDERQILEILQKKFPNLDWLLTERTFMRLKSMIYLNSFSFTAHSLKVVVESEQTQGRLLYPL